MSIPLPFWTQYECRNETLEIYAADRRGHIVYAFNNYGYRNDIDYSADAQEVGLYLGSSIMSGIGLQWKDSFAAISANELAAECYQFSQGCMPVDNQESLRMLRDLKLSGIKPRYWVIQFIDLDRRFKDGQNNFQVDQTENLELFLETFRAIQTILYKDIWIFLSADKSQCPVPEFVKHHDHCVGWNVPFIDYAGVGEHPGKKWHKMISAGIIKKLSDQFHQR